MDVDSSAREPSNRPPGTCIRWEDKREELPALTGDEQLLRTVWQEVDSLAYVYIWHCLVSF